MRAEWGIFATFALVTKGKSMKAVFIVYNQALSVQVQEAVARVGERGFTRWENVTGAGSATGEPHLGTHTWPAVNTGLLVVTTPERKTELLEALRELNSAAPEQGLRVFTWEVEEVV